MIDRHLRNYAGELPGYNEFLRDFGERRGLSKQLCDSD